MTVAELIAGRRSTRSFDSRPVPREDLVKCLEAARLAPSACNAQPWKFILVDDPVLKDKICDRIFAGIYAMNQFAKQAPVLAVVVSEKEKFLSSFGGQVRDTKYYLVDIGIACEHFILQAEELGIATCWIGWFDEKPLKELLAVPRSRKIDIVIPLGYPAHEPPGPRPRRTIEDMSSFNAYGT